MACSHRLYPIHHNRPRILTPSVKSHQPQFLTQNFSQDRRFYANSISAHPPTPTIHHTYACYDECSLRVLNFTRTCIRAVYPRGRFEEKNRAVFSRQNVFSLHFFDKLLQVELQRFFHFCFVMRRRCRAQTAARSPAMPNRRGTAIPIHACICSNGNGCIPL